MEHNPVDDGYCSCGAFCDTGTGFKKHLKSIEQEQGPRWGYTQQRDELKPCPFCGTKAISQGRLADNSTEQQWRIQCGNPFCTVKCSTQVCASYEQAVDYWQVRIS